MVALPTLLAFDTSTEWLNAGLLAGGRSVTANELGGARASTRLLPLLQELLAGQGLGFGDVDAFAFGRGPGAFTGLRTACAVAQGLAWGTGRPVLPIDSLMIVAEDDGGPSAGPCAGPTDAAWVAMDARMDEVYAACYARDSVAQPWRTMHAPALYTLPALAHAWMLAPPRRVVGSAVHAFAGRLPWGSATRAEAGDDRGAALLRLALAAWHAGDAIDPALALPVYLRDKVALTTAERAAVAARR